MTVSFLPHSVAAWTVFSAVAGVLEGAYFSMLPDIIIGFVTLRYFSRTFGFAMLSQGAFSAVLFPVLGKSMGRRCVLLLGFLPFSLCFALFEPACLSVYFPHVW